MLLTSGAQHLCVLDNGGLETLGVLDVDGLDVAVELLLGVLLVVTLAGDADTETERNALDAGLPDLLVELGVEADVGGALMENHVLAGDMKLHNTSKRKEFGKSLRSCLRVADK